MSIPGEVEIALRDLASFTDSNVVNKYHFEDGVSAPYSVGFSVSPSVDNRVFENLKSETQRKRQQRKKDLILEGGQENANGMRPYDTGQPGMFVWLARAGATIFLLHDARIFNLSGGGQSTTELQFVTSAIAAFHPRPIYTLPQGPGVCIPYGFLADDGKADHDIGVTMRLKDHPEVEIFFEDQTAPKPYKTGAHQADSKHLNFFFLEEQAHDTKGIKVLFPGYHSATLGGYPATASFFEIKRKDGVVDFGYAANVAGDYTAKTDTPQLMMYVIRTASRAKGKPVSKTELKDMAQKIAASIKRREVK